MLQIDTDKIWKLLKKDKNIQKELKKYIKKEEKKLQEATSICAAQRSYIDSLYLKKEKLSQKEEVMNQQIVHKNGDISFLEVKKMFAQSRLKRLQRILRTLTNSRKIRRYEKKIQKELDYLHDLSKQQELLRDDILNIERDKEYLHDEQKDLKKETSKAYDQLEEDEKIMNYWLEEKEKKEARFYQASFQEVSENFKPCQDLVVPDLEETKKMTTKEAKEKANPILIDEEYILSDPKQLKVRRLTKDEKEEYRKRA